MYRKHKLKHWLQYLQPWASADFFPGEGKNFSRGGQEPTFCLKSNKKVPFFQKSLKTYYFLAGLGGPGGGGKNPPCPPLRTPMFTTILITLTVSYLSSSSLRFLSSSSFSNFLFLLSNIWSRNSSKSRCLWASISSLKDKDKKITVYTQVQVDPRISQIDKIFAKNGPKFIFFKTQYYQSKWL